MQFEPTLVRQDLAAAPAPDSAPREVSAPREMSIFAQFATDHLTHLTREWAWIDECPNGCFAVPKVVLGFRIAGMTAMTQARGHEVVDQLLLAVIDRVRQAIPADSRIIVGSSGNYYLLLPVNGSAPDSIAGRLLRSVSADPIALPHGAPILPRLLIAHTTVAAGDDALSAVATLDQQIARLRDYPSGATCALGRLERHLLAHRFFGREGVVEVVFRHLGLEDDLAGLVLIVGQPRTGKAQLLSRLPGFFVGQPLPVADIACRPYHKDVPFSSIVTLLGQYLSAYLPGEICRRLTPVCAEYPWVGRLFPVLRGRQGFAPFPATPAAARAGLAAMLLALIDTTPHIAFIHDLHDADAESIALLASIPLHHGLRVVASVAPESAPRLLHQFKSFSPTTVRLHPYNREEMQTYLSELGIHAHDGHFSAHLHALTGGRQMALEQLLLDWAETSKLEEVDGAWVLATDTCVKKEQLSAVLRPKSWRRWSTVGVILAVIALIIGVGVVIQGRSAPPTIMTRSNPGDGATMVYVPAGEYALGVTPEDAERLQTAHPQMSRAVLVTEQPGHQVKLDGYWMYKYEVTVAQYRRFCVATGRPAPEGLHDFPVTNVSWNDAMAYCRWAGVTLPTEAQWESAVRGPLGQRREDDFSRTADWDHLQPAGSRSDDVSPFGLHDMIGNAAEWCADRYDPTAYQHPDTPPTGTACVWRGGIARAGADTDLRVTARHGAPVDYRDSMLGFRCVGYGKMDATSP